MPTPVSPSEIKSTIPSASGSFCAKFLQVLQLPKLFSTWYSYVYNEDLSFTDDFKADLCLVRCTCSGGGSTPPDGGVPGGPIAPTNVQATDGAFSTKVVVTWNSVTAATSYEILRGTVNDFSMATVIGTTTGNLVVTFEDTAVTEAQVYYYWVRAYNGTLRGASSSPDTGYAVGALSAVTDLKASRGFYQSTVTGLTTGTGTIALVFTAASGANAYDIYRGTTNVFSAATKIDSNRMPFDTSRKTTQCVPTPCTSPIFVNNGGHLLYYDKPASIAQKYYYWVVAKMVSGSIVQSVSEASNTAYGWIVLDSTAGTQVLGYDIVAHASPVPNSRTRAYVVLVGPTAGGAGGNDSFGGGGGGGGAIIAGYFNMVAGPNRRWKMITSSVAGGASAANGTDSIVAELQYDDGGGIFATILDTSIAGKGLWNAGGGGAGGAGSVGSVIGAVTDPETEPGFAGEAASGTFGGRGGCDFGFLRSNPHNFPNAFNITTETTRLTQGGGGSDALPGAGASADGGIGSTGYAIIVYF